MNPVPVTVCPIKFFQVLQLIDNEEIQGLLVLCQFHPEDSIPVPIHYEDSNFATAISLINKFSDSEKVLFSSFLEGCVLGLQRSEPNHYGDFYFISGQNNSAKIEAQSNTITSDTCLNIDPSILAQAIESGVLSKEDLKPIFQSISNKFTSTPKDSKSQN